MNADDLSELKTIVQMEECQHSPLIRKALAHIDAQAEQIAYWQKCYEDLVKAEAAEEGAVRLVLNAKDRQIAALKAALADRDLRLLEPCNGECGKNDIKLEDCDRCEREYVISQLVREMPQIDWEDMK
jgi:hypothetical protein